MSLLDAAQAPPMGPEASKEERQRRKREGKKSYGKTAKRGAAWSMLRQAGHEIFGIPTAIVIARLLTPADFGIAAAADFFLLLAVRLTQFGLTSSLVRIKHLRPEHVSSVFVVNLAVGLITYLSLFLASPFLGEFFRSPETGRILPVAALTFVIGPFGSVAGALIQRRLQFRHTAVVDWTDNLFGTTSTILLALNGWGYWSIVLGHLAGATVRAGLQVYLSGWRPSLTCSREALRDLIPFGLGLHSKRLLEYAVGNVDNLVVGRILGMTALGYYDKAFTTTNRLATRLTLGQAPFRIFSIIHEDVERFRRAYTRLILAITLLTYPVLTGCMVVATPLLTVLFGEKWLPSVVPFQVLAVCGMLKVLNAYAGQANEASGNIWAQVRRMAVGSVLVIVGAGVGSRYGGVTGAAVGVLVAMVILTVSLQALVRKATGLTWRLMLTPQIPAVTCAAALAVVLLATGGVLRGLVPNPAAWQLLLVQTTVGAIFYVAFTLYSPFVSVRELVLEFTQDLVPARVRQALGLRTPEARPAQAMQASTCDSSPRDNAGDGEQ